MDCAHIEYYLMREQTTTHAVEQHSLHKHAWAAVSLGQGNGAVILQNRALDALLTELKAHGMTQTAFAESIGMPTRLLSAIKASELRNRYFHELDATKLACLWVLEHLGKTKRNKS